MSEINVTPLVDVMLVLLIIFMVAAPLLVAGVPLQLPDARAQALPNSEKPITISLDARGRTFIDEEQVAAGELPARFAALAARQPEARILFRADRASNYGTALAVLAELSGAGLTKVALVTEPRGNRAQ